MTRDEKAEAYAKDKLQSSAPDFPQTFRKYDLIQFAKEDWLAGHEAARAELSEAIELLKDFSCLVANYNQDEFWPIIKRRAKAADELIDRLTSTARECAK